MRDTYGYGRCCQANVFRPMSVLSGPVGGDREESACRRWVWLMSVLSGPVGGDDWEESAVGDLGAISYQQSSGRVFGGLGRSSAYYPGRC